VVDEILGVVNDVTPNPELKIVPPVDAAYQSIVSPEAGVAEIKTVPASHLDPFVPLGKLGVVISCVTLMLDVEEQPFAAVTVTV
jgi:hypothetical protein